MEGTPVVLVVVTRCVYWESDGKADAGGPGGYELRESSVRMFE